MTSIVEIANQVCDAVRARASVTSICPSDGTLAGNVLTRQFWPRVDALMRGALWNFARYEIPLTLLKAMSGTPENPNGASYDQPPTPWLYEYALPTGAAYSVVTSNAGTIDVPSAPLFLRARFVVNDATSSSATPIMTGLGLNAPIAVNRVPPIPYLVAGDLDANGNQLKILLTNKQNAKIVYTARVTDPTFWDPNFVEAAVSYIGAWSEQAITGNLAMWQGLAQQAQGLIMTARIIDGDENPTVVDNVPDWMAARSSGAAPYGVYGAYDMMYDSVVFPGGTAF